MPTNVSIVPIADIASTASATAAISTRPVRVDERGIGSERFGAGKRALLSVLRGISDVAGTMAGPLGTIAVYGSDLPAGFGVQSGNPIGNAFATPSAPAMQNFTGDGTTTRFQTIIPYVAFSNYNWIVETLSRKLVGTFTVTDGVIAGSSTTLNTAGVNVLPGDALIIGGQLVTVVSVTSDTVALVTPAVNVAATAIGYQISQRDRIKTYNATEALSTEYDVEDVGGFALIDFGVAPPAVTDVPGAQASNIAVYYKVPTEILASGTNANVRTGIRSRTVLWTLYDGDSGDDFNATKVALEVSTAS